MSRATYAKPSTDLDDADMVGKAADAFRSQVDSAECKHVILGLLDLKYISDTSEPRREQLADEPGFRGTVQQARDTHGPVVDHDRSGSPDRKFPTDRSAAA